MDVGPLNYETRMSLKNGCRVNLSDSSQAHLARLTQGTPCFCSFARMLGRSVFSSLQFYGLYPTSSVCGISQARILEWVAVSSFRGSSSLRDQKRHDYKILKLPGGICSGERCISNLFPFLNSSTCSVISSYMLPLATAKACLLLINHFH